MVGSKKGVLKTIDPATGLNRAPKEYTTTLKPGETYASGPGHAEKGFKVQNTAFDGVESKKGALEPGDQILAIGVSRNICHGCEIDLEAAGIKLGGEAITRHAPGKTDFRGGYSKEFYKELDHDQ